MPGTTTDPVAKPMELQPLGPVVFIDTAGVDDVGELGRVRNERSLSVLDRCDIVLLVAGAAGWDDREEGLLRDLERREVPVIAVLNQADLHRPDPGLAARLARRCAEVVTTSAETREGIEELRQAIVRFAPTGQPGDPTLIRDLVPEGGMAVLVIPIDKEAPVGRLIMPQVNAIRDLLDGGRQCLVVARDRTGPPRWRT